MRGSGASDPFVRGANVALSLAFLALGLLTVVLRQTASAIGAEVDAAIRDRRALDRLREEHLVQARALRAPDRIEAAVVLLGRPGGPE